MQVKNLAGQLKNGHGVQSDVSLKANSPKEPKCGFIPTYALILGYKLLRGWPPGPAINPGARLGGLIRICVIRY